MRIWPIGAALLGGTLLLAIAPNRARADGKGKSEAPLVGDPEVGARKAANCAGCHGIDGNSIMPAWPKLAGQHSAWLEKQLHDFQSGSRKDPMMSGMVEALNERDIADLAAWFASNTSTINAADRAVARRGERLYNAGRPDDGIPPCVGCHGGRGRGYEDIVPGGFPRLAGQHQRYTAKALRDFREGTRQNDYNEMMRSVAGKLTDADIEDLSQYLAIIR